MTTDTVVPHSRRALLAAALGGLAASVAALLGRPLPTKAAAGDALIIGVETNNAGTANTQLLTNSNVVAFKLLQNGPGTALMGYATPGSGGTRGVYGRTDSPNGHGVQARNQGAAGTGAAVQAIGVNNHGVDASTDNGSAYAVKGVTTSTSGRAIYGYATADTGTTYGVVGQAASVDGYGGYFYTRVFSTGWYEFQGIVIPAAPIPFRARLYMDSLTSELRVRFANGVVKTIATPVA